MATIKEQLKQLQDDVAILKISEIRKLIHDETQGIVMGSIKEIKDEFTKTLEIAKSDLINTAQTIFSEGDFMGNFKKRVFSFIEQEVRDQVKNEHLHKLIGDMIKDKIRDNFKNTFDDVVIKVINTIVDKANKKLTREYKLTKELTYSINTEIKHTLMKTPISINTEKIVKEKIMEVLENIDYKDGVLKLSEKNTEHKLLENKADTN